MIYAWDGNTAGLRCVEAPQAWPWTRGCSALIVLMLSAIVVWSLCAGVGGSGGGQTGGGRPAGSSCGYSAPSPGGVRGGAGRRAAAASGYVAGHAPSAGSSQATAPDPSSTLGASPHATMPAASPFADDAFRPSEATEEFYSTFNPQSLAQMMPSHWRPGGGKQRCDAAGGGAEGGDEGQYSQFARYSISPEMMRRSEGLRGMMRLQENTMTTNSKTLGMPNLLQNAVTPLRATPIGSGQFVFQDSQLRQGFIAAATGAYPSEPA